MKRLQISIEPELDERLGARAIEEHTSKAALIRRYVADRLGATEEPDPIEDIIGMIDDEPGPIDDLLYRP